MRHLFAGVEALAGVFPPEACPEHRSPFDRLRANGVEGARFQVPLPPKK